METIENKDNKSNVKEIIVEEIDLDKIEVENGMKTLENCRSLVEKVIKIAK